MSGAAIDRLLDRLVALPREERRAAIRAMTPAQAREFDARWRVWAHDGQYAPPGDWRVWMIRAGRGFGKTRAGAEWVTETAAAMPGARIALVGATGEDVRQVMVEGPSGLIAIARIDRRPAWQPHTGVLRWPNGASARVFSAEAPERLRGPEHHAAWCDELAKWRNADATWDNLAMTLRLGDRPRAVVTTTPRATALMRRLIALPALVETRGRTRDNPHLPATFVAAMTADYGGTYQGRQELDGEMIDAPEGSLWPRALIEARRAAVPAAVARVVVGVDPPASSIT